MLKMNPELTATDIEEHAENCNLWCNDLDLLAGVLMDEADIKVKMQARFVKTFG